MNQAQEQFWQLVHEVEAYLLHEGYVRGQIPDAKSALAAKPEAYSFLSQLSDVSNHQEPEKLAEEAAGLVQPASPMQSPLPIPSKVMTSDWQALQDELARHDYRLLDDYVAMPQVMVVLSYDQLEYALAKEYVAKWLQAIGVALNKVYYTGVLKKASSQPQVELDVQTAQIVRREIELIQPKLLLLCGRLAYEAVFEQERSLAQSRMQRHRYQGYNVLVTYDPQMVLAFPKLRRAVWQDMQHVKRLIEERP